MGVAIRSGAGDCRGHARIRCTEPFLDQGTRVGAPAAQADHPIQPAMEFQHRSAAGLLVQSIDILSDDQGNPVQAFKMRQRMMAAARIGEADPRPAEKAPRPVALPRGRGTQEVVVIDGFRLLPVAVAVAVGRDAARCAQTGARQDDHETRFQKTHYHLLVSVEFFCGFSHDVMRGSGRCLKGQSRL